MLKHIEYKSFLGNNQINHSYDDFGVALTRYFNNIEYEEWHSHKHSSLSFLINGTYTEEIYNKNHKRNPGDIKFIPAGEAHRCNIYTEDTRKINLELKKDFLKELSITESQINQLVSNSMNTKFIMLKLYHEILNKENVNATSLQLLVYELFNLNHQVIPKKPPAWALILKEILHEHFLNLPDLNSIAHEIGVHPVTISKYFPRYFSSTISLYVKKLKVDKSIQLIKTKNWSLTQIAHSCGFADQGHFTRSFKELTGFLPKDFRKA